MGATLPIVSISRFSDAGIQAAIDRASAELPPDKSGLVIHADGAGGLTASIVARAGGHITVKAGAVRAWDGKISGEAELIAVF